MVGSMGMGSPCGLATERQRAWSRRQTPATGHCFLGAGPALLGQAWGWRARQAGAGLSPNPVSSHLIPSVLKTHCAQLIEMLLPGSFRHSTVCKAFMNNNACYWHLLSKLLSAGRVPAACSMLFKGFLCVDLFTPPNTQ